MKNLTLALALAISTCAFNAQALTATDFDYVANVGELVDICGAPASAPMADEAKIFCYGYLAAAIDYHDEIAKNPEMGRIACGEGATREDVRVVFLGWAARNPEYKMASPIEGLLRAASEKWPCS